MGPTLLGYAIQGSMKYGFYEIFKRFLFDTPALEHTDKIIVYMLAGAMAETIGSSFLAPFEACRIRLVADPKFANGLFPCFKKLIDNEGMQGLYRGLPAILVKQLPFTIVQLSMFETIKSYIYNNIIFQLGNGSGDEYKFLISFVSATIAGIFASLASQPGDTLLSAVNKKSRAEVCATDNIIEISGKSAALCEQTGVLDIMKENIEELGITGLFTGTKARLVHVVVMVVIQLLVYDYVKQLCGIPITTTH